MESGADVALADIALVAAAIGNRARASILERLLDAQSAPAGTLADVAGVARSTASAHLEILIDAGLLSVERRGRQRRYRLASPDVAHAIEALATIAPRRPVTSLRGATSAERLRTARTCYDHLAGRLGVAVSEALVTRGMLRLRDGKFVLTRKGEAVFTELGINPTMVRLRKRAFAIPCLDWTERRMHLAGALGAALCDRFTTLGWIERPGPGREVVLTTTGAAMIRSRFGVDPRIA
jgi:DNA-binding transcriptional ArsR family regulator